MVIGEMKWSSTSMHFKSRITLALPMNEDFNFFCLSDFLEIHQLHLPFRLKADPHSN
jgi:hypothetical protein